MVLSMISGVCSILFVLFLIKIEAQARCLSSLAVHSIYNSNNSVLRVDDEGGARDIKVNVFSINGCSSGESSTTGSQQSSVGTWLSHINSPTGSACLQVVVSSYRVLVSFQAVVVRANSWTLFPSFSVDGISAEYGAPAGTGYRETVAVFGIKDKALVSPKITLATNSALKNYSYIVPAWASRAMGLEIGAVMASGAEYSLSQYMNCSVAQSSCQMKVQFDEQVDAYVVLFALAQRAASSAISTAVMSEMKLGCGCRCRVADLGTRFVTSSVNGVPGQCARRESTAPLTECDVFGDKWCDQKANQYFEITGSKLSNGNYPCTVRNNYVAEYLQEFTPVTPF